MNFKGIVICRNSGWVIDVRYKVRWHFGICMHLYLMFALLYQYIAPGFIFASTKSLIHTSGSFLTRFRFLSLSFSASLFASFSCLSFSFFSSFSLSLRSFSSSFANRFLSCSSFFACSRSAFLFCASVNFGTEASEPESSSLLFLFLPCFLFFFFFSFFLFFLVDSLDDVDFNELGADELEEDERLFFFFLDFPSVLLFFLFFFGISFCWKNLQPLPPNPNHLPYWRGTLEISSRSSVSTPKSQNQVLVSSRVCLGGRDDIVQMSASALHSPTLPWWYLMLSPGNYTLLIFSLSVSQRLPPRTLRDSRVVIWRIRFDFFQLIVATCPLLEQHCQLFIFWWSCRKAMLAAR